MDDSIATASYKINWRTHEITLLVSLDSNKYNQLSVHFSCRIKQIMRATSLETCSK